jgi:hypothetical protein
MHGARSGKGHKSLMSPLGALLPMHSDIFSNPEALNPIFQGFLQRICCVGMMGFYLNLHLPLLGRWGWGRAQSSKLLILALSFW